MALDRAILILLLVSELSSGMLSKGLNFPLRVEGRRVDRAVRLRCVCSGSSLFCSSSCRRFSSLSLRKAGSCSPKLSTCSLSPTKNFSAFGTGCCTICRLLFISAGVMASPRTGLSSKVALEFILNHTHHTHIKDLDIIFQELASLFYNLMEIIFILSQIKIPEILAKLTIFLIFYLNFKVRVLIIVLKRIYSPCKERRNKIKFNYLERSSKLSARLLHSSSLSLEVSDLDLFASMDMLLGREENLGMILVGR